MEATSKLLWLRKIKGAAWNNVIDMPRSPVVVPVHPASELSLEMAPKLIE